VAVIGTSGIASTLVAKKATSTIPITFGIGVDPVQARLIKSLNQPGGNMTGITVLTTELTGKRLELLHELAPTASVVAGLVNPSNPSVEPETSSLQVAARSLGLQLHVLSASTPSEIDTAFGTLVDLRAAAFVVSTDPLFTNQRAQSVALAARHAVPSIYGWREVTAAAA
jgi:putative tryptophan/tyrosine transport system substrate-binding protein